MRSAGGLLHCRLFVDRESFLDVQGMLTAVPKRACFSLGNRWASLFQGRQSAIGSPEVNQWFDLTSDGRVLNFTDDNDVVAAFD